MKSVLLKVNTARAPSPHGGVTLAYPGSSPGDLSGTRYIIRVLEVPDVISVIDVVRAYASSIDMSVTLSGARRYSFRWDELGEGKVVI